MALSNPSLRDERQAQVLRIRHLLPGGLGCNHVATAGVATVVLLLSPETDALYGVNITPSWGTTVWVTGKTTTQFTANFGTGAGGGNVFDWHIFRREP